MKYCFLFWFFFFLISYCLSYYFFFFDFVYLKVQSYHFYLSFRFSLHRTQTCCFSGFKIQPGFGKRFIRGDMKTFIFFSSKTAACFFAKRNPRKCPWTVSYRITHKKGHVCYCLFSSFFTVFCLGINYLLGFSLFRLRRPSRSVSTTPPRSSEPSLAWPPRNSTPSALRSPRSERLPEKKPRSILFFVFLLCFDFSVSQFLFYESNSRLLDSRAGSSRSATKLWRRRDSPPRRTRRSRRRRTSRWKPLRAKADVKQKADFNGNLLWILIKPPFPILLLLLFGGGGSKCRCSLSPIISFLRSGDCLLFDGNSEQSNKWINSNFNQQ